MEGRRPKKVISYHESDEEEEELGQEKKEEVENGKGHQKEKETGAKKKRKLPESDEEEEAEMKDDDSLEEEKIKKTPKKKSEPKKSTSKPSRKKKKNDSDEEEEEADDDEDDGRKNKRSRKSSSSTKSTQSASKKRRGSKRGSDDDDENEDNDDEDEEENDDNEDEEDGDGGDDDEEDEEEEEDENGDAKPRRGDSSSRPKPQKKRRATKEKSTSIKVLTRLERLEEARKAYKWWEAEDLPNGVNWRQLEHPGIIFAPPYVRHNVPLLYDGEPVELTSEQEEVATFYASIPEDGPQLGNPKTREVFQQNFFTDFKSYLGVNHPIKKFEKCDFRLIREHLALQKSIKKAATEEEKLAIKKEKEAQVLTYGYALIDGRIEKMGNYNMEPPGLFRGRGEHPRTGALKRRTFPESVGLNLSVDACVPKCHLPGHAWESVRHDPMVTWLCGWNENVQQSHKYVMLAASSSFKGKSDLEKYEKAMRLASHITKIRKDYTTRIKAKDITDRQLGTAMWVIDVLALRVGGEKGEDEADTVGCCSLRVEHVTFMTSNSSNPSYEIELEFLGKDSMLFKQTINFATYGDLGILVYRNLSSFCARKKSTDDIFDKLTPAILNRHLNSLMKGLSAKVFRTYNASVTLEKELPKAEDLVDLSIQEKMVLYNAANRQVAILCNHQRTVSKAAEQMFENLNEKLETMRQQRTDLLAWKDLIKKGKENKIPLKEDDTERVEEIAEQLRRAQQLRDKAKTVEEKLEATAAMDAAKLAQKNDQKRKFQEKHLSKTIPTLSSLENKIQRWQEDIRKLETDIRNRDENKEVALGTSKINYMDPRISVAWCKRCEVPIDKVFAKTLRDKFNWAMAVPPDWRFIPSSGSS